MADVDLGIVKLSFDVKYPTIDFAIDLVVPDDFPKIGGKRYSLDRFSLSLDKPKITIPIGLEFFGGSITLELDFPRCEVKISGEVTLDVVVKKLHSDVGPANPRYMKPLEFKEPSWSENPVKLDPEKMQSQIDNAPVVKKSGPSVKSDSETKDALKALFKFCGAESFIEDGIAAASRLTSDQKAALANQPDHPLAKALASKTGSGGALVGFGVAGTGGAAVGAAGGAGVLFTADGTVGFYGSGGLGIGAIVEVSAGLCDSFYWPDEGQSALECFQGANALISIDGGEGVSGSVTLAWPVKKFEAESHGAPCGIAIAFGVGGGVPLNFWRANSDTWTKVWPPGKPRDSSDQ